jgi:hypothetical protein
MKYPRHEVVPRKISQAGTVLRDFQAEIMPETPSKTARFDGIQC